MSYVVFAFAGSVLWFVCPQASTCFPMSQFYFGFSPQRRHRDLVRSRVSQRGTEWESSSSRQVTKEMIHSIYNVCYLTTVMNRYVYVISVPIAFRCYNCCYRPKYRRSATVPRLSYILHGQSARWIMEHYDRLCLCFYCLSLCVLSVI